MQPLLHECSTERDTNYRFPKYVVFPEAAGLQRNRTINPLQCLGRVLPGQLRPIIVDHFVHDDDLCIMLPRNSRSPESLLCNGRDIGNDNLVSLECILCLVDGASDNVGHSYIQHGLLLEIFLTSMFRFRLPYTHNLMT
jgi:hypothetical protein